MSMLNWRVTAWFASTSAMLCAGLLPACGSAEEPVPLEDDKVLPSTSGVPIAPGVPTLVDSGAPSMATPRSEDTLIVSTENPEPSPPEPMACGEDVDVVFVMDVSSSMDELLDKLADEILVVDRALAELALPSPPNYGLVVFVDDVLLVADGEPFTDALLLNQQFVSWSAHGALGLQIHTGQENLDQEENSLDALYAAATEFRWRPAESTARLVIHATNGGFKQGPRAANSTSPAVEHSFAETLVALQEESVRVFAFTLSHYGWLIDHFQSPPLTVATDGKFFFLRDVLSGELSLSDALVGAVETSLCNPIRPFVEPK